MENKKNVESVSKSISASNNLPSAFQMINQSTEYQVIEKAAHLLKKVEQHWKKSLFQNKVQFSPVSDSLNSSESDYIEKLAAIKFKDASFRNPSNFTENSELIKDRNIGQHLNMTPDIVHNYFDLMEGPPRVGASNFMATEMHRADCFPPTKCSRCLAKEKKKSVSVLPTQQYVLKQNTFRRNCSLRQGNLGPQSLSPRSIDSVQTARTCTSAYSIPAVKAKVVSQKVKMSSSNPDLRANSSVNQGYKYTKFCTSEKLNLVQDTFSKSRATKKMISSKSSNPSNVSVLNVKSNNVENSILEVNPRKTPLSSDKMIIIQHLPQIDIRPELSKQSGPVISIEADSNEVEVDSNPNNIGIFNYTHKTKQPKGNFKDFKPFYSSYPGSRNMPAFINYSEEEFFAAQLELRSVAENFIFRLKRNDNPSGYILVSSVHRLMNEVSEMIEGHLSGNGVINDPNLPPRMEMVSDLLSDELKTWGFQQPSHYQSLNNIIQHLILDIQFAKSGNIQDLKVYHESDAGPSSQTGYGTALKTPSILKTNNKNLYAKQDHGERHTLVSASNDNKDHHDLSYRTEQSHELTLSDKLLQENALKVQRLEKVYKINHRVRILQENEKINKTVKDNSHLKFKDVSRHSSISENLEETPHAEEIELEKSENPTTCSNSHPVVAIFSQQNSLKEVEHEKSITEDFCEAEDRSATEQDLEKDTEEVESIPEEEEKSDKYSPEPHEENVIDETELESGEKVQEDTSDPSHPEKEKHKENTGSEYDEDFEPDLTDQPDSTVSNSSQIDQAKAHNKKSVPHNILRNSNKVGFNNKNSSLNNVKIKTKKLIERKKSSIIPRSNNIEENNNYYNEGVAKDSKPSQTELLSNPFVSNDNIVTLNKEGVFEGKENDFLKVHVRDKLGEIILSYAGPNQREKNMKKSENIVEDRTSKEFLKFNDNTATLVGNNDNYINAERKTLENLTKNILKDLLDEKMQEILTKFSQFDSLKPVNNYSTELPSTSKQGLVVDQDQVSKSFLKEVQHVEASTSMDQFTENPDLFKLKSPSVTLNIETVNVSSNLIENKKDNTVDEKVEDKQTEIISKEPNDSQTEEVTRCSPDVKYLLSLVEELDSSDIEYCEASLKQISDEETKQNVKVSNENYNLHHINSDEFLIFPKLNPQPADLKILQYSSDTEPIKDLNKYQFSETHLKKQTQEMTSKSVATDIIYKEFEKIEPSPDSVFKIVDNKLSTCSTQTDIHHSNAHFISVPSVNLVDVIEISCSHSSSSSESHKLVDLPSNRKADVISSKNSQIFPEATEISLQQCPPSEDFEKKIKSEKILIHPDLNEQLSASNETQKIFVQETLMNKKESDTNPLEGSEQHDEVVSTSTETETTHSDIVSEPILRVIEASTARCTAWSSSSDSSSDNERIFFMNQPTSDDDDVLADLEQLMEYLNSSKSSSSKVRIRRCSRHKKS